MKVSPELIEEATRLQMDATWDYEAHLKWLEFWMKHSGEILNRLKYLEAQHVEVPTPTYLEFSRPTIRTSTGVNEKLGVVFHHTAGAFDGAVRWLSDDPAGTASAHVVIAKDGRRAALADDDAVTWHAGDSTFKGRRWCNRFMIGVEFELTREDVAANVALTDDHIASALEWLAPRWAKYGWTLDWMTDHRQVSPGRKTDLSVKNWQALRLAIINRFVNKGD